MTGVSPVSSGGDTGFRLITVMSAEKLWLPGKCRKSARSADAPTLHRIRILWIPGFPLHYGRSQRLGWPEQTEDLKYFYPTDVLVTGYDIIFFWVIRMIFSGYEQMGERPFKTVLFHGLVRDSQGRKMSKSLGNGIDPLEIIDKYGADALRLTLITGNAPGNDMRFYYERVEASRNFANKIWNASRFIMMNMTEDYDIPSTGINPQELQLAIADKWILSKFNRLVKEVTDNMDSFELGIAVQKVYDFIWDEFCDWYIEMVKPRLYNSDNKESKTAALWTLKKCINQCIEAASSLYAVYYRRNLLHLTVRGRIHYDFQAGRNIRTAWNFEREEKGIELIKEAVRGIRNVRTKMNVAPSKKASVYVVTENQELKQALEDGRLVFASLACASEVILQQDKTGITDDMVSVVILNATIYMPFAELVDIRQEIERLEKEEKRLSGELARVNGMLNNERFMSKAPEAKVAEEREKLVKYSQMMEQVKERLAQLRK